MPIDNSPAEFSFLPWLRYGLGNEITEEDTLGVEPSSGAVMDRPEVSVSFEVEASKDGAKGASSSENVISKTVKIQGPGDVLGIDPKMVIRTHPKQGVDNFEIENLAYVEFYEEDLPWRFTPAKPKNNKLRPWMSLILLKKDEFEIISSGSAQIPFLRINSGVDLENIFGNERDTWAFAHVHLFEKLNSSNPSSAQLQAELQKSPDSAISRIISPRRLEQNTEYQGFLIPTFETGRLAGLQQNTADTPAQQNSWNSAAFNASHPREYPFYFNWSFKTGVEGTFESLVSKLEVVESGDIEPVREADITNLGYDIEVDEKFARIQIEGALKTPGFQIDSWPSGGNTAERTALMNKVQKIINLNEELQDDENETLLGESNKSFFYTQDFVEDPIVTPPLYGKWHALKNKAEKPMNDWVDEINLHPSYRAVAGLGTRTVMKHQEYFMELAWEQIGQINEANQKIIENDLMRNTAKSLYRKNINKMSEMSLLSMTANAMKQFKVETAATFSAAQSIKNSKIPNSLSSGNFIKVANNFTPTAVMSSNGVDGAHAVLNNVTLQRSNISENFEALTPITPAPVKKEPSIAVSSEAVYTSMQFILANQPQSEIEQIAEKIKTHITDSSDEPTLSGIKSMLLTEFGSDPDERTTKIINGIRDVEILLEDKQDSMLFRFMTFGENTPAPPKIIAEITINKNDFRDFVSNTYNEAEFSNIRFISETVNEGTEVKFFSKFFVALEQQSFVNSFQSKLISDIRFQQAVFKPVVLPSLQINDFSAKLRTRLLPHQNYLRRLGNQIKGKNINLEKPIMAYPRFPIPVYNYLEEISPDYIVPNISEVPKDSILLMEVNSKFIESYLMGMNHEMSRELLWREFPTDMRGSYFRHFWEYDNSPFAIVDEDLPAEEFMEKLKAFQDTHADVEELHKWKNAGTGGSLKSLGENGRSGMGVVLMVKGDLFKKYPNTLVYAQKGNRVGSQIQLSQYNSDNASWPVIKGHMEPDIYFFGFELTVDQVKDGNGYFFVFREIPGQISFGLDAFSYPAPSLNTWNDMNWGHMGASPKHVKIYQNPKNLSGGTPANEPIWNNDSNAADIASILYQSPILFAKHASNLLT